MRTGIYPGTFDPVTNGHLDIMKRSLAVVDRLIVAVSREREKAVIFSSEERVVMIQRSLDPALPIVVEPFDGLLVDFARARGATVIIRGLRALSDFEFEFQMALMNRRLAPQVEILFMAPDVEYIYLSSSLVREVASLGGNVATLVPPVVEERLRERIARR